MCADFFRQYPYLCDTFSISYKTRVELDAVDAGELLSPYRIDFMAKLLWIEACHGTYDRVEAEKIYKAHLLAFSNHLMTEPGQPGKKGFDSYCDRFRSICTAASTAGDLLEIGDPIPVDSKNMAMDGAHRISAAVYYQKRVPVYRVAKEIPNRYDYHFFRKRYLEENYLLEMVEKYVTLRPCRLYLFQRGELKSSLRKRVVKECAPVYMKKMWSKEVWIILDITWLENNGKIRRAEELLGNHYLEGTQNILLCMNARRRDLLMQERGYLYKKRLGIYCGMCWAYFKVLGTRLLGRPV